MTIAQIEEAAFGVIGAAKGKHVEGTPFVFTGEGKLTDEAVEKLKKLGFSAHGVKMIDGRSGRLMEDTVYVGLVYYLRLAHLAMNKRHARSKGPVTTLTRQPAEGRSKDGGLRFGEMEVICLVAYASAYFLKERMIEQSDAYKMPLCTKCGIIGVPKRGMCRSGADLPFLAAGSAYCLSCSSTDHVQTIEVPYAFKLLLQELFGMGIVARLETEGSTRMISLLGVHDDTRGFHPPDAKEIEERLTSWAREKPDLRGLFDYMDGLTKPSARGESSY